MEARAYGKEQREYTFKGNSAARPEIVYGTLADLGTHLDWAGARQWKMFRLLSLTAPEGQAVLGTRFASTGNIPMSSGHWEDQSEVTAAEPPTVFELTTHGCIPWSNRPAGEATLVHRYEIVPRGSGSSVTYRVAQLRFREPPWGLRYRVLRSITARVWIPIWFARGFRSMLSLAAERSRGELHSAFVRVGDETP